MACAHAHPTNKARPQARPRDTHTSRTCSHTSLLAEWEKRHTLLLSPRRFSRFCHTDSPTSHCVLGVCRPVRVLGQPRSQAQTSRLWDIADGSRGELGLGDIGGICRQSGSGLSPPVARKRSGTNLARRLLRRSPHPHLPSLDRTWAWAARSGHRPTS